MRVAIAAAVFFLATIASAANAITKPTEGEKVPAGKPYVIQWTADTAGPIIINLRRGQGDKLNEGAKLVELETNFGNWTWPVPGDQEPGNDYALEIKWGKPPGPEDVNYSATFEVVSGSSGDQKPGRNETTTKGTGTVTSDTPSPTGGKHNGTDTSATETSGSSTPKATESATSTHSVPGGAPGAFGASAASVAAVVAVAAAVLFN